VWGGKERLAAIGAGTPSQPIVELQQAPSCCSSSFQLRVRVQAPSLHPVPARQLGPLRIAVVASSFACVCHSSIAQVPAVKKGGLILHKGGWRCCSGGACS
jgi:hypothetical protein